MRQQLLIAATAAAMATALSTAAMASDHHGRAYRHHATHSLIGWHSGWTGTWERGYAWPVYAGYSAPCHYCTWGWYHTAPY